MTELVIEQRAGDPVHKLYCTLRYRAKTVSFEIPVDSTGRECDPGTESFRADFAELSAALREAVETPGRIRERSKRDL